MISLVGQIFVWARVSTKADVATISDTNLCCLCQIWDILKTISLYTKSWFLSSFLHFRSLVLVIFRRWASIIAGRHNESMVVVLCLLRGRFVFEIWTLKLYLSHIGILWVHKKIFNGIWAAATLSL